MLNIFKDDVTKQLSFSRISAALAFMACLIYAGYSIYKTAIMPDIQSGWMSYILGAYGINKFSSTVKEVKNVADNTVE